MSPVDDGGVLIFSVWTHCGILCFKHSHCPRRAWLLCVEPTLWDPVCKSCALPLCTDYILGRLWPQGIRCSFSGSLERDREKKNYFELKIWPGTHSLLSCPRMCILGELSRIYRGRLEYLHGNVGCCKWTTLTSSTLFGLVPWWYHACCIMH